MLNSTIISATQMLTPLWSEQIVKHFTLDYRYCTVFTLILNGISNAASFSDTTASILISLICVLFSIYFSMHKFNMKLINFNSGRNFTIVTPYNGDHTHVTETDLTKNFIEKFLFQNQKYFLKTPYWICDRIKKVEKESLSYALPSSNMILQDGYYNVSINYDLKFSIRVTTVEKKLACRSVTYTFSKGDENLLFQYMTRFEKKISYTEEKPAIFVYPSGVNIGFLNTEKTIGNKNTFFGYYNPKLDMIIDWVDSLSQPTRNNQERQFSIICHGKPGTGKTAIVKRIAEYTSRDIIIVNLLEVKKKIQLLNLFYSGTCAVPGDYSFDTPLKRTIFFIDEFDKVVVKLKLLKQQQNAKSADNVCLTVKTQSKDEDNFLSKKDKDDKNEMDWDLDDLLEIFCGSYIPNGRMIIAACNDLEIISLNCPFLVRPGRLTPIEFDFGDKSLFLRIVLDYANITLSKDDIPDDYRFVQAYLIEYLSFKQNVTREDILQNLGLFRGLI